MLYNISFDICAIALTGMALYTLFYRRNHHNRFSRIFLILLLMHMVALITDIASSFTNSYPSATAPFFRDAMNYIFLAVHSSEAFVFLYFLIVDLEIGHTTHHYINILLLLPECCFILFPLLLNPWTHAVFYYDKTNHYVHGPMMYMIYGAVYLYLALCLGLIIHKRERLTQRQYHTLLYLFLLSGIPVLIQSLFMPHQLIEMYFQALGFYGFLQLIDPIDQYYHPVTRIKNFQAMINDLSPYFVNQTSMYAIIIKISRLEVLSFFSQTSDISHSYRLLITDWLSSLVKRGHCYDCEYGIYVLTTTEDPLSLCQTIQARMASPWQYRHHTYQFSVQITPVQISEDIHSMDTFIHMVHIPYFHTKQGCVFQSVKDLARESKEFMTHQKPEIPYELQEALDTFLHGFATLTPAERSITDLYIHGHEIREIPDIACISVNTVKKHNKNIYHKLGIKSKEELLIYVDLFQRCGRIQDLYSNAK